MVHLLWKRGPKRLSGVLAEVPTQTPCNTNYSIFNKPTLMAFPCDRLGSNRTHRQHHHCGGEAAGKGGKGQKSLHGAVGAHMNAATCGETYPAKLMGLCLMVLGSRVGSTVTSCRSSLIWQRGAAPGGGGGCTFAAAVHACMFLFPRWMVFICRLLCSFC